MRFLDDLLAILTATAVLLAVIVVFPNSPVRVGLGLPFVLFFPGYALIAALYPRRDDLDGIERLALSLGLSLAVVPLMGLALNYMPWGIRLTPILVGLTLFTVTCCAVAARNRGRLPAAERFPADVRPVLASLRRMPWVTVGVSAVAITVLLALGFRIGLLGRSRVGEAFTEFYVLGPGGKAEGYPRRVFAGDAAEVILGIANREGRPASYRVEIRAGEALLNRLGPIALKPEEQWEERVRFAPRRPGDRVKVEFLLYIDGAPEPYRQLHLWLQVRPP